MPGSLVGREGQDPQKLTPEKVGVPCSLPNSWPMLGASPLPARFQAWNMCHMGVGCICVCTQVLVVVYTEESFRCLALSLLPDSLETESLTECGAHHMLAASEPQQSSCLCPFYTRLFTWGLKMEFRSSLEVFPTDSSS